jgi:arginase family enzyme
MAGTVVETKSPRATPQGKRIDVRTIAWTSDASGDATAALSQLYGFILKLVTVPSATAAPTDNYDISLVDENGIDALGGAGADRDTANKEQVAPVLSGGQTPVFLCGDHTFTVANAGNAKSGTVILYIVESL